MTDSDPEEIGLSTTTLSALQEFYAERDARAKQFEDLKAAAEENSNVNPASASDVSQKKPKLSMEAFAEDWNESQFWYADETALTLAEELLDGAFGDENEGGKGKCVIAVVSAPSVFVQVKNLLNESTRPESEKPKVYLLEYDRRFEVFPEFVFYDFNNPFTLPPSMKGEVDRFIVDPPFLSEDCQTRAAMTVKWLSKPQAESHPDKSRTIVCTGERMESLITKIYKTQGVQTTTFEPVHSKGLSNEFLCYANFESENWKWKKLLETSS